MDFQMEIGGNCHEYVGFGSFQIFNISQLSLVICYEIQFCTSTY